MIAVRGLSSRIGRFALRDVSFEVPEAGYGVVIGPAGSGKTTLLETVAGIRPQTAGAVWFGDREVSEAPPESRDIGFVYQHAFLFPHLTVEDNIAYGASDPAVAREVTDRLGASELIKRNVGSLSGGERQLVALARALARRPAVLLLDEPFSALDPRRRTLVRREVRSIHRTWGMTVLQVTHDFTEAGLLGDVAILLDAGRVLQYGPPERVFREPASPYVAEFLGAENVFAGTVRRLEDLPPDWAQAEEIGPTPRAHALEFRSGDLTIHTIGDAPDGPAYAVIRAEEVVIASEAQSTSMRNQFIGRVTEIATLGALTRVTVQVGTVPLVAALTTRSARELEIVQGRELAVSFKAMAVHLC
jgi:molybdopterin-binding protein